MSESGWPSFSFLVNTEGIRGRDQEVADDDSVRAGSIELAACGLELLGLDGQDPACPEVSLPEVDPIRISHRTGQPHAINRDAAGVVDVVNEVLQDCPHPVSVGAFRLPPSL